MTKTYKIGEAEISFKEVTAIWDKEPEAGRRYAIFIHDEKDDLRDGDGVIFG